MATGHTHAVRWDAQGALVDLGTLGGDDDVAYGILATREPPVAVNGESR